MNLQWKHATWTNQPENAIEAGDELWVTAKPESDYWNRTSYGFIHDSGHGLISELKPNASMELEFFLDFDQQFDQAGLILFADNEHWIKAGVEFSDNQPQAGAVVTNGFSDWSVSPVSDWASSWVRVRLSRTESAVTIRAGVGELRLIRVAPIDPELDWSCGPMLCSPTRSGLTVRFRNWHLLDADGSLH
jgi:hypothetical protein